MFAKIDWDSLYSNWSNSQSGHEYYIAVCDYCKKEMIWQKNNKSAKMVYLKQSVIPPEKDMPEKVRGIYEEASLVLGDSPRASYSQQKFKKHLIVLEL